MQYYDKLVVGNRIKQMRKQRNMTQSRLAEVLDYTNERQLQRIENGETGCTVDKLMEIAQILNISTDYLLFGIENQRDEVSCEMTGGTEGQKLFMRKISKVVFDNIELLVPGR